MQGTTEKIRKLMETAIGTKEAMEILGIGERMLRKYIATYPGFPSVKVGAKLFYDRAELEKWKKLHKAPDGRYFKEAINATKTDQGPKRVQRVAVKVSRRT